MDACRAPSRRRRPPSEPGDPVREPHAPEDLYRRHATWLHGRLRRRLGPGSAADAEDLVQETYARAVEIERSELISHPRALLLRIAGRLAIDHTRRARRLSHRCPTPPPSGSLRRSEQDSDLLLKQIIVGLPPRLRDVFVLSRVAGFSYDRIADELGVSVKTVEARMSKGAGALRGEAARLSRPAR